MKGGAGRLTSYPRPIPGRSLPFPRYRPSPTARPASVGRAARAPPRRAAPAGRGPRRRPGRRDPPSCRRGAASARRSRGAAPSPGRARGGRPGCATRRASPGIWVVAGNRLGSFALAEMADVGLGREVAVARRPHRPRRRRSAQQRVGAIAEDLQIAALGHVAVVVDPGGADPALDKPQRRASPIGRRRRGRRDQALLVVA